MSRSCWLVVTFLLALVGITAAASDPERQDEEAAAAQQQRLDAPPLSSVLKRLLEEELTTQEEKRRLRLWHGQWGALGELEAEEKALQALLRFDLRADALQAADAPPLLAAEAALLRGEPGEALRLLEADARPAAVVLRARAHEHQGDLPAALDELTPLRDRLMREPLEDPAQLTAGAEALVALARLEGRPAHDYQLALDMLSRVRTQLDPLYWPAHVAEARLLLSKDGAREAQDALTDALSLNPRSGEAWRLLGEMAVDSFNFAAAAQVVERLREINPQHLLADLVEIRSLAQQRQVDKALAVLQAGLQRHPHQRDLLALAPAIAALAYDEQAMDEALQRYEQLVPGGAEAHLQTGSMLAMARQYDLAGDVLREAVQRAPNDSVARIELGLMLMQAGHLEEARNQLTDATRLDPFNRRAANSLQLVVDLLGYETIETEHFVIRYQDGLDAVLARDMVKPLEQIYRNVTTVFQYEPKRKTQIDILPDEKTFGVRITGLPEIWTIAASTGPVIAITPPREGRLQRGSYDWFNVIQHEFVHTVTLEQSGNRLPHWFTEASAVSMETTGTLQQTAELLAKALQEELLFPYEDINWGFIRPKAPYERQLAYAQAHWMLQYITQRFGHQAVLDMLSGYARGHSEAKVLAAVTGLDPQSFMQQFRSWAAGQVQRWGLAYPKPDKQLQEVISGRRTLLTLDEVRELATTNADHPELDRQAAMIALQIGDGMQARQALLRYAAKRPLDPWPHRALVQQAMERGNLGEALPSLQQLDKVEGSAGNWAHLLAQAYRAGGQLDAAAVSIERALQREPYNATYRELAATIAIQRQDMDAALLHLQALPLLEPDRPIHQRRLDALKQRLGG